MVADLGRLSAPRGGKHLIKNGTVLFLVSLSLHLRGGGVEEVHTWINNTLQLGAISKLLSGIAACSFLFVLRLPWSGEPETTRLAETRLMPAPHTRGQSLQQLEFLEG
jgi:hypothetical protein